MGRRNKLQKFAEILNFDNVYENVNQHIQDNTMLLRGPGNSAEMKGTWSAEHFKNNNPIVLELACGRGEYSLALGRSNPEINYIGIDVKGARIWQGANIAIDENITNVAFVRTRIEMIKSFFTPGEVDEIWITFPDPFLKESKEERRLTSHSFLARYKEVVKPGGLLHLKTDDPTLFDFSMETLTECEFLDMEYCKDDIYASTLDYPELEHKTYYEKMHLQKQRTIKYIRCRFK